MTKEDYKEYANAITEKLDNTQEYALWLAIQTYVEELQIAFDILNEKNQQLKTTLNEIKEYITNEIKFNENLIERLEGTSSFRIGNTQSKIKMLKEILEIIERGNK